MLCSFGEGISILAGSHSVINADQDITLVNNLVLLNHNLLQDAALKVLNHLDFLRRDDLSQAPGHLVQNSKMSPENKNNQQHGNNQCQHISD